MTEKRYNVWDIDGTIFLEDHKEGSYHIGQAGNVDINCLNDIANRLNNLSEENEQLQHRLSQQEMEYATDLHRLTEENEQLKKHIQELQNHLKRLENENISLKKSETATEELLIQQWQQNTKIKHTIKEAIYNERTELGKSVLKQLLNNIEAIQ